MSLTSQNAKNSFFESFENPYYELCREKMASVDEKKEKFEQERLVQQQKKQKPSQGLFTSKVAKNPNLFESKKYEMNSVRANWVMQDQQINFFSRRN